LISDLKYNISPLPGFKEGISASINLGYNLGISKYVPRDKLNSTIEAFKYITSKEIQRDLFLKRLIITPVSSLYYDEEVCKIVTDCELFKQIQPTGEPEYISERSDYDYSRYFKKYIYQYLYQNKSLDETIKNINDITKIYYISLESKDSNVGIISFMLISVISLLMLLSLVFIFRKNLDEYFSFMSKDFWFLAVLGSIIILWVPITNYGNVTSFKCHLKLLLLSIGFSLNKIPIISKLIIIFPEKNKFSNWVKKYEYVFLFFNLLIDISLNGLLFLNPITPKSVMIDDGENFQICKFNELYIIFILLVYKIIIIISLSLLIFIEWNIKSIIHDMMFFNSAITIDILTFILLIVFIFIKIDNYISYFLIHLCICFIMSISNYIFLYGIRVILAFTEDKNSQLINNSTINNESESSLNSKTFMTDNVSSRSIDNYNEVNSNDNNNLSSQKLTLSKSNDYLLP